MQTNAVANAKPEQREEARMTVREARDRYLEENMFSMEEYTAPKFTLEILGLNIRLPNSPSRQRAIPLHDIHHVLTGYGTDLIGEAEIGVFELRGGCNSFITYYLNGAAVLLGLFLSPRRMWRAFVRSRGVKTLYKAPISYEELLEMSVEEARAYLGISPEGLAEYPARLHRAARLARARQARAQTTS